MIHSFQRWPSLKKTSNSIFPLACVSGYFDVVTFLMERFPNIVTLTYKRGRTALHYASKGSNYSMVKVFIEKYRNLINVTDNYGNSPLHLACKFSTDPRIISLLLESKANLEAMNKNEQTPMHCAAKYCNMEALILLIKEGANVNAIDIEHREDEISSEEDENSTDSFCKDEYNSFETSPLHYAIQGFTKTPPIDSSRRLTTILLLLDSNANVNQTDEKGNTPLLFAAQKDIDIVQVLISRRADVNLQNKAGESPLHHASSLPIAKLLVSNQANINLADENGETPAFYMFRRKNETVAKYMLKLNAVCNTLNKEKRSLLSYASERGDEKMVKLLLKTGITLPIPGEIKSPLLYACENGRISIMKMLLKHKPALVDVVAFETTETPLSIACRKNYPQIIQMLITQKANVNCVDKNKLTPIYHTCSAGNVAMTELLLANKANLSSIREEEYNLLFHACKAGHKEIVDLLLKNNILSSNKKSTKKEHTLLHMAVKVGHANLTKKLLKDGAPVDGLNKEKTPLYIACNNPNPNASVIQILLQNKADVNTFDRQGKTPLASLCSTSGNKEVLLLLISYGASINTIDKDGKTPLHEAVKKTPDIVKALIESKANINHKNRAQETALYLASKNGRAIIVDLLLQANATVEIEPTDREGKNPLHHACLKGHTELVKRLLDSKANPNTMDLQRETPVHCVCRVGHIQLLELLLSNGARISPSFSGEWHNSPLHVACSVGNKKMTRFLIENGADVNAKNHSGVTPLHAAAIEGKYEIIAVLLERKADVNAMTKEKELTPLHVAMNDKKFHPQAIDNLLAEEPSFTHNTLVPENLPCKYPLHFAVRMGHMNLFKYVLKMGVSVHSFDEGGTLPIHTAAEYGQHEILKYLLTLLDNFEIVDARGETPLHKAASRGHLEIVKSLINDYHVNVSPKNLKGLTPFLLASANGHQEVVKFILNMEMKKEDMNEALHLAATNKAYYVVETLLEKSASVLSTNSDLDTPLHHASRSGSVHISEMILNYLADVNARNADKETPLLLAASHGHIEIVQLLLSYQSTMVDLQDEDENTPLSIAEEKGHEEIVYLLRKHIDKMETKKQKSLLSSPLSLLTTLPKSAIDVVNPLNYMPETGLFSPKKNPLKPSKLKDALTPNVFKSNKK
eukprot:TRINITY_DN11598_c0_g1_i1.p1 TRINITY_DN11598_c0_g1~~TRINITY_DN11598_c0_g1_i1.p1  ORF type:complete len:1146 (-),score=287.23 TRINITY_DN11598_c0_g1_i1:3-3440(-)